MALRTRRSVPSDTGLMPMPEVSGKRIFFTPISVLQEVDQLLGAFGFGLPFDAGVDVFGVFTEDHHVGQVRRFSGEGTP